MGIALIVCTVIVLGSVGLFVFGGLGTRSRAKSSHDQDSTASPADTPQASSLLPQVGATVTGDFFHRGEQIHALCHVEKQDAPSVGLRIVTEVGKVPLWGVQPAATGQLIVSDRLVPFRVTQVDFPVVIVEVDLENVRQVNRRVFRLSPDFSARFRPKGDRDGWLEGKGLDLSQEGLSLCVPRHVVCRPEQECDIELTVRSARTQSRLALEGEVRWTKPVPDGTAVGIHIGDGKQHQELAELVFHLQHQLSRRPKDYMTEYPR